MMNLAKFYNRVYDWLIVFGQQLILGTVALFIGLWVIKILIKWIQASMHRKEVDSTAKPFLLSVIGVVLRVLLILGVMQILGIEMTLFTALVGAFGVAAGLALSGTLQILQVG